MFTIEEIIDLAIRIEKNGETVYREAIQRLSNPSLVSMLQWLADEEAAHGRWFGELKEKVKTAVADPRLEEMSKDILQGILGEQSFSLEDADFSKISQVAELLSLAIEFEEDTVLFYEMIGSVLDDERTVEHLNRIIEEEKQHVQVLKTFLEGLDD